MKNNLVFLILFMAFLLFTNKAVCQQISEDPWFIPITISLNGVDKQLHFGNKVGATDGYDSSPIDTLAPPQPPTGFYIYFSVSGIPNLTDKLSRDYKSVSKSPNDWTLKIINTGGDSGTISWNSSNFPTGAVTPGNLTIDGNDMLSNISMSFSDDQILNINYIAPIEVSKSFSTNIPSGDPPAQDFGETGITIDFSNSPGGDVTVDLMATNPPDAGSSTIPKYWDITSTMTNGTFLLDLQFAYDEADVSGLNENALIPVYYDDLNSQWMRLLDYTLDTANNTMTVHNLDHFTKFAIGELAAFGFILSDVKVFLEGPFNSGTMNTTLRNSGFIPLNQPYNVTPWNYAGEERVSAIPADIVDWILIEIRTGTEASTKIASRACFLKSDGSIVDLNGLSPVGFDDLTGGSYYLVIHHRNHLSIMSQSTHGLSQTATQYDFTDNIAKAYTSVSAPMKTLNDGSFGLFSSDATGDGQVTSSDFNIFNPAARTAQTGYQNSDWNLDGQVTSSDFNIFNPNARNAARSQVPTQTKTVRKRSPQLKKEGPSHEK